MMPRWAVAFLTMVCLALLAAPSIDASGKKKNLKATLTSAEEVPSVSSTGSGEFRAKIDKNDSEFTYELEFQDLEGDVTQAHIHLGQFSVNGGIMIWLCGTAALPGPSGTPACPTPGGTVTGTVTAASVIGPAGQGVAAGEFAEALAGMRDGVAYANVHSTKHPGGEIRGQIK
jgi:hypothetical protein